MVVVRSYYFNTIHRIHRGKLSSSRHCAARFALLDARFASIPANTALPRRIVRSHDFFISITWLSASRMQDEYIEHLFVLQWVRDCCSGKYLGSQAAV